MVVRSSFELRKARHPFHAQATLWSRVSGFRVSGSESIGLIQGSGSTRKTSE